MNTEQNYVGGGDNATPNPQAALDKAKTPSVADYRQHLLQHLTLLIERERQWLAALDSYQSTSSLKPMTDYLTDHIAILNDGITALSSAKYPSLSSTSEEIVESLKTAVEDYIDYSMTGHIRACENINKSLAAKGITTLTIKPVSIL